MNLQEYRGFPITVDTNGNFFAVIEGDSYPFSAVSLKELKEKLDQYINRRAKERKLSLAVVNQRGERVTITGIHLRTGKLTGIGDHNMSVLPAVEWIIAAFDRIRLLREEIDRIQEKVQPYTMYVSRHSSGGGSPLADVYAEAIDKLEQEYKTKYTAAVQAVDVEEK